MTSANDATIDRVPEDSAVAEANQDDMLPTVEQIEEGLRYWFGESESVDAPHQSALNPDDILEAAEALFPPSRRERRRTPRQEESRWDAFADDLPDVARRELDRVRTVGIRFEIAGGYIDKKFGWVNGRREVRPFVWMPVDRIEQARAWRRLFSGPKALKHLADLKLAIDNWLGPIHEVQVMEGRWPGALPSALQRVRVINRVLTIDDGKKRKGYPGLASYREQTPPELFVLDHRAVARRFNRLGLPWARLGGWDLSAGSATGAATLEPLGWRIVSTDLTVVSTNVSYLDARSVGASDFHKAPFKIGGKQVPPTFTPEKEIVLRPHIIFLDVSSRGFPTHAEEYGLGEHVARDFAALDRDTLVVEVAGILLRGLRLLRRGGCFSLTVRESWRSGGRIVPDHGLTEDILNVARSTTTFEVIQDYRIAYENPRNQAFLGRSRAPIRHALLGRPA